MIYDEFAEVLLKMDGYLYVEHHAFDPTPVCEAIRNIWFLRHGIRAGNKECKGPLHVFVARGWHRFYLVCENHLEPSANLTYIQKYE